MTTARDPIDYIVGIVSDHFKYEDFGTLDIYDLVCYAIVQWEWLKNVNKISNNKQEGGSNAP